MTVTFCNRWSRHKKHPVEIWDKERALAAHVERKLYVALVGPQDKPSAFIEFNGGYVGVGFLDAGLREYVEYTFSEAEPGRLFLVRATHREFVPGSNKVSGGSTYFFKPDGTVKVERDDFEANTRLEDEMKADVAGNWESYPPFGEYESLARLER